MIEPVTDDERIVGNDAAAAYVGMKPTTWRSRVHRAAAPQPDGREISSSGHALPVWNRSTLDDWLASGSEQK